MNSPEGGAADHSRPRRRRRQATASPAKPAEALVLVTLKAADGSIVKIETVNPDGSERQLSPRRAKQLLGERLNSTLHGLVQQAFEAGIACVLDERTFAGRAEEDAGESEEEADLHDLLLDSLIERTPAKQLLRREVLNSAMLGTIIREASAAPPGAPDASSRHRLGGSSPARRAPEAGAPS
ncbi:MAG: hypothetical protein JO127_03900 [Caulobacteraceae bacterium]|nr:hypothetical protein [Caulobacteraceae bacterium]